MRAAAVFSDHMVLQRDKRICVWGEATDGECIRVTLCEDTVTTTAQNGKWRVELPPMPACDHLTMTIVGAQDTIVFSDVAIGEVWLCGGQSNMEFEMHAEQNGTALLESLTPDCRVRFYYTPKQRMKDAQFELIERNTCWGLATPEGARAWSAVGLYFALELQKSLGVTIGLIGCNWGGTSASAWIPRAAMEAHTALHPYLADYDNAVAGKSTEELLQAYDDYLAYQDAWNVRYNECVKTHPGLTWENAEALCGKSQYPGPMGPKNEYRPSGLYETMLQRVCPYTLRGFLYYQGESDDHRPDTYAQLLEALIDQWRRDWQDAALPFLFVQLPMFRYAHAPDDQRWCKLREAQLLVSQKLRHTALAVIPDCGAFDDIHPKNKAPVGHRLALQALCEVYGVLPQAVAAPPAYDDYVIHGDTMELLFENAPDGFAVVDMPTGFELAGADGVFHPAQAVLNMPRKGRITLHCDAVPKPCYARYLWTNYTDTISLYSVNGLPVSPFRTYSDEVL